MRVAKIGVLPILVAATLACRTPVARAQGPEPLFGEWELRPEDGDYVRIRLVIVPRPEQADPGRFRVTYDLVGTRGGVTHLEWTGRLDGEDHRVQGLDYVMTNAYTPIDTHTFRIVTKVEGEVQTTAETVVSPDGRTMTTVTRGRSASGAEVETRVRYTRLR